MRISMISRSHRASLLVASLAFAGALGAQGLSYDMSTSATAPDRTGAVTTQSFMSAHGQFDRGMSRIDVSQSMAPGGIMGAGTYMITSASKGTVTSVDPAKHEFTVIDIADLGKSANDLQSSLGGLGKMEFTDIKVGLEDLGAGEPIDGYATYKYRLTQSFNMRMTVMGHAMNSPSTSTTDIWVAPQLDGLMDPSSRPMARTPTGPMAELTTQLTAVYGKMKKGLPLRRVTTSVSGDGKHQRTNTMTMTISNVKKTSISPSVFEVPASYTKVDVVDAIAASAAAAQAQHKPE